MNMSIKDKYFQAFVFFKMALYLSAYYVLIIMLYFCDLVFNKNTLELIYILLLSLVALSVVVLIKVVGVILGIALLTIPAAITNSTQATIKDLC
jgi:ABC-type Mn2+/Zn2+ transport system permease subunit